MALAEPSQPASLEVPLLDPKLRSHFGIVAAHLLQDDGNPVYRWREVSPRTLKAEKEMTGCAAAFRCILLHPVAPFVRVNVVGCEVGG